MSSKQVLTRSKKQKARALLQSGQLQAAKALYEQVCHTDPRDAEAWGVLGAINGMLKKHDAARACCQQAVTIRPDYAQAHNDLGAALVELGRLDEAIACHRRALQIDPRYADAYYNLGNALSARGQLNEAIAAYREAVRLRPDDIDAWINLGHTLTAAGFLEQAVSACRQAVHVNPNRADAYHNLAVALAADYRLAEAEEMYRSATRLNARYVRAWRNFGLMLLTQGRAEEAVAHVRRAVALDSDNTEAFRTLLFVLNYDPATSPETLFAEHRRWGYRHAPRQPGARQANVTADPHRRLRVGYVSPDFRAHSVAYFIEPVLARHDPEAFETYCYAEVAQPDAITARLRQYATHWRDTFGKSDDEVANMIRNDAIDILVDLAGHTAHNRLAVFARQPAPVQVTYLGYPNTTGLPQMDYRLTDVYADPPGQEGHHTETLVRLPRGFLCYAPPREAPAVGPAPASTAGHITFGSFNAMAKINEGVVALWAKLLEAVPRSRLLMKNHSLRDAATRARYAALFEARGIAPDRLDLVGSLERPTEHLMLYNRVDIGLDPFPYNGTTTTCEALWMGVPVMTLAGDRHAGRVGASLLTQVGLTELVAQTPDDYVRLAAALAGDRERLTALRAALRERMQRSPLCDAQSFTRDLEAAYRERWQAWCADATRNSDTLRNN